MTNFQPNIVDFVRHDNQSDPTAGELRAKFAHLRDILGQLRTKYPKVGRRRACASARQLRPNPAQAHHRTRTQANIATGWISLASKYVTRPKRPPTSWTWLFAPRGGATNMFTKGPTLAKSQVRPSCSQHEPQSRQSWQQPRLWQYFNQYSLQPPEFGRNLCNVGPIGRDLAELARM